MDPDLRNPPRRVRSPFGLINSDGYEARLRHNSDESVDVQQFTTPPGALTDDLAGLGAGALTNGAYTYRVTFVTAGGETEGGTVSAGVTVVDAGVDGQVALTAIPVSPNPQVTSRRIYRTIAGGSAHLLQSTIANNTATTLTDNTADAALTTAAPTVNTARDTTYTLDMGGGSLAEISSYRSVARWFSGEIVNRNIIGAVSPAIDTVFYTPIIVPRTLTIDGLGFSCTTGAATSVARIGLYRSGGPTLPLPRNLVVGSGEISCTATAEKIEAIAATVLVPGLYWFAFLMGVLTSA